MRTPLVGSLLGYAAESWEYLDALFTTTVRFPYRGVQLWALASVLLGSFRWFWKRR